MDVKRRKLGSDYISTKRQSLSGCRNHAAKTNRVDGDWVSQLPVDILCDLLSRVPTQTTFSCRCVSKAFLKVISCPYFAKMCNSRLTNNDSSLIMQQVSGYSGFYLGYTDDIEINLDCDYCPWQASARPGIIPPTMFLDTELVGSVNGLLCIRYKVLRAPFSPILHICNPILGEFIPLPRGRSIDSQWFTAFGFCPKTEKYKVIRLATTSLFSEIHTVGTDCWRTIKNAPYPRRTGAYLDATCLNGNVYWTTDSFKPSKLICSFNLQSEKWEYIPPPSHINQDTLTRICGMIVGVLGGLFCICYVLDFILLDVCVMTDYGVWSRKLTIDLKFTFGIKPSLLLMIPMRVLDNGDLLLSYYGNSVVYYNSRKGTYRDIAPWQSFKVVDHVSNFISLKDILGVKYVEVVHRKKIRVHWSSPDWGIKYFRNHTRWALPR